MSATTLSSLSPAVDDVVAAFVSTPDKKELLIARDKMPLLEGKLRTLSGPGRREVGIQLAAVAFQLKDTEKRAKKRIFLQLSHLLGLVLQGMPEVMRAVAEKIGVNKKAKKVIGSVGKVAAPAIGQARGLDIAGPGGLTVSRAPRRI